MALDAGKDIRSIYVEGRGAETFEACVASFRTGGTLGLVGGLRVLGSSRIKIVERVRILKAKGVTPYDVMTGETDGAELLSHAIAAINGARGMGFDPRTPRRRGQRGGTQKGINAEKKRNAIMHDAIVQRLCTHPKLNWKDRAQILGEGFAESTLRRIYGDQE